MKIMCLIASLRLGGAERQMVGLAGTLSRNGHKVTVLTYRNGDFYGESLAAAGVERLCLKSNSTPDIVSEIAEHIDKSGARVLISFLNGANIKACLVGKLCPGLKVIVSERTTNLHFTPIESFRFGLYKKRADIVVCNNFAQEKFIREHYPPLSGKIMTIPNFVDLQKFAPAPAESDYGEARKIVVTARICARKNTKGMIRAAYELSKKRRDFRIDWYGLASENAYSRKCRRLIRRLGLDAIFALHDAVSDVDRVYRDSDIFCLPSFFEGTSNSLAEALACGLPVVCSRIGDNIRYVDEGKNGFLFDPGKPRSIAAALDSALNADLVTLGAASRIISQENFGIDSFERSYSALINKKKKKKIAAITMVRCRTSFLEKWIEYYSTQLGKENVFVYLDGEDQIIPNRCSDACNISATPRIDLPIAKGDRARARFLSQKAAELFKKGYDIIIGADVDEFIIPDPIHGSKLADFLSNVKAGASISALGIDVFQRIGEAEIDPLEGFLQQRHYGWLCPKYTKSSILFRPCRWGSGFHRVKRHNFHICKDLYLFHFGYCDSRSISDRFVHPDICERGWRAHFNRRLTAITKCNSKTPKDFDSVVGYVRLCQGAIRHIYAWNKPSMLGSKIVIRIPDRFEGIV